MGSRNIRIHDLDRASSKAPRGLLGLPCCPTSMRDTYARPVIWRSRAARRRRRTGAYVSGRVTAPTIRRVPVKRAMRPISQRHPTVSATKPPMMGPKMGPRKGASAKTVIATPRCAAGNMSAIRPPALVNGDAPKILEKKRSTRRVARFCEAQIAALKTVCRVYVMRKRYCRPYNSEEATVRNCWHYEEETVEDIPDRGAQSNGPKTNPKTKKLSPSVLRAWFPPRSRMSSGIPLE